jgi:L-lactate dehydrogenase
VFLWSSTRIGGVPLAALLRKRGETLKEVRAKLEQDVRYANITIIEGHDASQYGIGIVCARVTEMVLRDERAVVPVGSLQEEFGVTLSLPSQGCGVGGLCEAMSTEVTSACVQVSRTPD